MQKISFPKINLLSTFLRMEQKNGKNVNQNLNEYKNVSSVINNLKAIFPFYFSLTCSKGLAYWYDAGNLWRFGLIPDFTSFCVQTLLTILYFELNWWQAEHLGISKGRNLKISLYWEGNALFNFLSAAYCAFHYIEE